MTKRPHDGDNEISNKAPWKRPYPRRSVRLEFEDTVNYAESDDAGNVSATDSVWLPPNERPRVQTARTRRSRVRTARRDTTDIHTTENSRNRRTQGS